MFDATNHLLQAAVREGIEGEPEVDMPGSESIELVLEAVEGARLSYVTDPFCEEQIGSQEGGCHGTGYAEAEGR